MRVPVISPGGKPLMPTKPSRARKWVREAKAIGKWNKLGQYYIQLTCEPSGESTQPIAVGIDPGKNYAGVGVQSSKITLFAALRKHLGLEKQNYSKGDAVLATHAIDGVALAASQFIDYLPFESSEGRGHCWRGQVTITQALFTVIRRPPISRRQLHLMVFAKGGKRRKYGGTVTRHGFRKGDYVIAKKKGIQYQGWVSGDTKTKVSVSDLNWKRIAQFSKSQVQLLHLSTGLICKPIVETGIPPAAKAGISCQKKI